MIPLGIGLMAVFLSGRVSDLQKQIRQLELNPGVITVPGRKVLDGSSTARSLKFWRLLALALSLMPKRYPGLSLPSRSI